MNIREMMPADAPDVARIYNHYIVATTATFDVSTVTVDAMRRQLGELAAECRPRLVATDDDGNVLGYAYAHRWKTKQAYDTTAEITVYVDPQQRRRGIGTALTTHLIDLCRQAGYHALISCITTGNTESVAMHERLGFAQVSRFDEVGRKFDEWLGAVDYELLLR